MLDCIYMMLIVLDIYVKDLNQCWCVVFIRQSFGFQWTYVCILYGFLNGIFHQEHESPVNKSYPHGKYPDESLINHNTIYNITKKKFSHHGDFYPVEKNKRNSCTEQIFAKENRDLIVRHEEKLRELCCFGHQKGIFFH